MTGLADSFARYPGEHLMADWCRWLFGSLNEGGTWAVPRSGLVYQKQGDRLVLVEKIVPEPSPEQFVVYQDEDAKVIAREFAAAGITVTTGATKGEK